MLIRIDDDIGFTALHRESHDLICKTAGALRGFGLVLRCDCELVLLITGKLPLAGDVFGGDAHVITVKGVGEAIFQHGVDHLEIAHLHAAAQVRAMGRHGHGFLAAGNDDVRVAGDDLLHAEGHGAQTGAAKLIEAEGGRFLWYAGLHGSLPRRVLPLARRQDLTENDFIDFVCRDTCALQHGADDGRPELMGWRIGEVAIEGADGCARGAGNHD